ncbi:MAG: HD-GYP domain-containing protein [Thermoleophilia bacterium]
MSRTKLAIIWVLLLWISAIAWLVAAALGSFSAQQISEASYLSALVLIIVAIAAEEMSVELSPDMFVSVGSLPIILAILFINPFAASIIALVAALIASRGFGISSIAFNAANYVLSTAVVSILVYSLAQFFSLDLLNSGVSLYLLVIAASASMLWLFVDFVIGSIYVKIRDGLRFRDTWGRVFLSTLPSHATLAAVSLIVVAIYAKAGIAAAVLFLIPIFASQHVFRLLIQQKELLAEQTKLSQDLMDMNIGLAGALIMLLDSKDHYTASHSAGVAMYCRDMARVMGMSEDEQRIAHMAGLLHDLGKVGTPDSILKKEGDLTPREWELIKEHPTTAAEVLSQLATHKEIADIIRHHQEHFDGSGYPYGLKGDDIPELSRMLAVADTYHALTSNRPYRDAKSPFEALIILRRVAGTQLDPKYVEVMAQVLKNEDLSYREGSKADFLTEFRKGRPALKLDALNSRATEK